MLVRNYNFKRLTPIVRPQDEKVVHCHLPIGGPYGTGGGYVSGQCIGPTGVAKRSEIRTIAITGSPTGAKVTITFVADKTYTATTANLVTTIPTDAEMKTALETIFGVGNVAVVKTVLSYAITFQGILANREIGGVLSSTATYTAGTDPAQTHTRTQRGSVGPGQFDKYVDGTNEMKGALLYDSISDPLGGLYTENGLSNVPQSVEWSWGGTYRASDLIGLDAAGVADCGRFVLGSSVSDANSWVAIGE